MDNFDEASSSNSFSLSAEAARKRSLPEKSGVR